MNRSDNKAAESGTTMVTAVPNLPIAEYTYRYAVKDDAMRRTVSGSIWHGVLGAALRELVCIDEQLECATCTRLRDCEYPLLFRPPVPVDSKLMRKADRIMPPHVIQLPLEQVETSTTQRIRSVSIVLVGESNRQQLTLLKAMQTAGCKGIGKHRDRFDLISVVQSGPNGIPVPVFENDKVCGTGVPHLPHIPLLPKKTITVDWVSPYVPKKRVHSGEQVNIGDWLLQIIRRISFLQYFYTGKRLYADFAMLKALTNIINVRSRDLQRVRTSRYSAHHAKAVSIVGWKGSIDLSTEQLEPIWPFLVVGQWLNVPTYPSMGFGQYRIRQG